MYGGPGSLFRRVLGTWTTLQRWIRFRGFPVPVKLGPNTTAWPESEIDKWLASRPAACDKKGGAA
jgi:predicted DNA-binding transcriptional regulator AlpA